MRVHVRLSVNGRRLGGPGLPRRAVAAIALAVALAVPGTALAGHLFSDVPNTNGFHDAISSLAGAGVTSGCGGTKYCPKDAVTREQMAAFLNRGLGRVAEADAQKAMTGTGTDTVTSLTITPGIPANATAGANQFVKAQYAGTVRFTNVTGCPCTVAVYLSVNGTPLSSFATAVTVSATNVYVPLATSGVAEISGSDPATVALIVYTISGGGPSSAYTVYANVTAQTIPFGSTGGDTLSPASAPGPAGVEPLAVPAGD